MNKTPDWHRRAVAQLQWKHLYAWLLAFGGALAIGYVFQLLGFASRPWTLLFVLPFILAASFVIPVAYRRGLEDGRAHPTDAE